MKVRFVDAAWGMELTAALHADTIALRHGNPPINGVRQT